MLRSFMFLSLAGMAVPAVAAPLHECRIRVIRPVTDDMGDRWAPGKLLPVTIMRRNGGGASFCAHGGSCIRRTVRGVEAVRLVNCKVGAALGGGDYRLNPASAAMSRPDVRRMRMQTAAEAKLASLGFSNAASGSWSNDYAARPTSARGRLVARALAGSSQAVTTMKAQMP